MRARLDGLVEYSRDAFRVVNRRVTNGQVHSAWNLTRVEEWEAAPSHVAPSHVAPSDAPSHARTFALSHREWQPYRLWIRTLVDRVEVVDLERAANLVPREIFENIER